MTSQPTLGDMALVLNDEAEHLEGWEAIKSERGLAPNADKAWRAKCFRAAQRLIERIRLDEDAVRSVLEQRQDARKQQAKRRRTA